MILVRLSGGTESIQHKVTFRFLSVVNQAGAIRDDS